MGTGKDTVADILVNDHGFVKVSLADPIKRAAMDWWHFNEQQMWGPTEMRNAPDKRYIVGFDNTQRDEEDSGEMKRIYLTPRHALQMVGTEVGRLVDKRVWVRRCLDDARRLGEGGYAYGRALGCYRKASAKPKHVVIPDVRFKNELEDIKRAGGNVILVVRPVLELSAQQKDMQHQSENDLNHLGVNDVFWDHVLHNDGTLEDLSLTVANSLGAITS